MLAAILVALLLSACGAMKPGASLFQSSNKDLASGVKSYEDGDYKTALVALKKAQDAGLNKNDQVLVFKYLAFIHCVSGQETQCREEFRQALAINPAFELKPEEAGHPVWGPVFRGEKAKYAK